MTERCIRSGPWASAVAALAVILVALGLTSPASAQPVGQDPGDPAVETPSDDVDSEPDEDDGDPGEAQGDLEDEGEPDEGEGPTGDPPADPQPDPIEDQPAPASPQEATDRLEAARELYIRGEYRDIVAALRPVVGASAIFEDLDPEYRGEIHRLLGLGLLLKPAPDREAAYDHFLALLQLNPGFEFIDGITPTAAVSLMSEVRADHPELSPSEGNGGEGAIGGVVFIERRVEEHQFWMVFFPPLGQFQNDDDLTGAAILGLEVLALLTNVGGFAAVELLRDSSGFFSPANRTAAESFQTAQVVSLYILGATVIAGVAHAWYGYVPEEVSIQRLEKPPPEFGALPPRTPSVGAAGVLTPGLEGPCPGCASPTLSGMLLRVDWPF